MEETKTDVFMSITSADVNAIAQGLRTHAYHKALLPTSVQRIWFYTKAPTQRIEYVVCIDPGKVEVNRETTPLTYGYRILQVWKLRLPISLNEAVSTGILNGPPKRYRWVPESFLESCPLHQQHPLIGHRGSVRRCRVDNAMAYASTDSDSGAE